MVRLGRRFSAPAQIDQNRQVKLPLEGMLLRPRADLALIGYSQRLSRPALPIQPGLGHKGIVVDRDARTEKAEEPPANTNRAYTKGGGAEIVGAAVADKSSVPGILLKPSGCRPTLKLFHAATVEMIRQIRDGEATL
jgi:hypothetical protein